MLKQMSRNCIAACCRASLFLPAMERRLVGKCIILCYHRVLPPEQRLRYFLPELVVTPTTFLKHCLTLRSHYDVLTLREALSVMSGRRTRGRPVAVVTFDDGYRDNFTFALPILRETGVRATFFVITNLVGTATRPWYDQVGQAVHRLACDGSDLEWLHTELGLAESQTIATPHQALLLARRVVLQAKQVNRRRRCALIERLFSGEGSRDACASEGLMMNWEQLAVLAAEGHEIGSHGSAHEILTQLDDDALRRDVRDSGRELDRRLSQSTSSFSYPNGDVDQRVSEAVAGAGYRCAVTVARGANSPGDDLHFLKRYFISEDRLAKGGAGTSSTLLRMVLCGLEPRRAPS